MRDLTWYELSRDLANTDLSVLNDQEVDEVGGASFGRWLARTVGGALVVDYTNQNIYPRLRRGWRSIRSRF